MHVVKNVVSLSNGCVCGLAMIVRLACVTPTKGTSNGYREAD